MIIKASVDLERFTLFFELANPWGFAYYREGCPPDCYSMNIATLWSHRGSPCIRADQIFFLFIAGSFRQDIETINTL